MKNSVLTIFLILFSLGQTIGQEEAMIFDLAPQDPTRLLMERYIQIESTKAIDAMYNFDFRTAEREFKWIMVKYPKHPIGHFLLGLNYWWQIVPDTGIKKHDATIHRYMDETIDLAKDILDADATNKEAAFFLAGAYGFKGRLYAERESWVKAAWVGKQALRYLEISRGDSNINPELLFGDGLYNFYAKWIRENYKSLKPLMSFFRKGNKDLGITQLENVAMNAFYTRMEARYFLVQIYAMENDSRKALNMSKQMHRMYPNNSFFHRYAARSSFVLNRMSEAEVYAKELLDNIEAKKYGYGDNEGRYGSYILGYINKNNKKDYGAAKFHYQRCIKFSEHNNSLDSGYYLGSQLALGDIAMEENDFSTASEKYKLIIDLGQKKSASYKSAKEQTKILKKKIKAARKS